MNSLDILGDQSHSALTMLVCQDYTIGVWAQVLPDSSEN